MSAPCFARSGVVDGLVRRDDGYDYTADGHEPLLDTDGRRIEILAIAKIGQGSISTLVLGPADAPHVLTICRYCNAVVLLAESELPR